MMRIAQRHERLGYDDDGQYVRLGDEPPPVDLRSERVARDVGWE